jgi:hypothetical protein
MMAFTRYIFFFGSTVLVGLGLLIVEVSTSHSVGLGPRRDLYLTTHITHRRQTSMPPAAFEPAIPEREWPHTHALDRAATGIGLLQDNRSKFTTSFNLLLYVCYMPHYNFQ